MLRLPRAQRFQAVRRQHKRNAVQLLRQEPRHRHIPGVRMHDIDAAQFLHLRQVQRQRVHRSLELGITSQQ